MESTRDWARRLEQWRIPESVAENATDPPWVLPREVFTRRADRHITQPVGSTHELARRALDSPGSVLDIGAASGATSLPLVGRAEVTEVTAVDTDNELLTAFVRRAEALGVPARAVHGSWPESAERAGTSDVVLAGNVTYNVADASTFVRAMTERARRRVIVEMTPRHPLTELNPLWRRFHGIERPSGPGVDDFRGVLEELDIRPEVHHWSLPPEPEYANFADLVEVTRRRLCLPPTARQDVDRALRDLGIDPERPPDLGSSGRELVTLTWPGGARR